MTGTTSTEPWHDIKGRKDMISRLNLLLIVSHTLPPTDTILLSGFVATDFGRFPSRSYSAIDQRLVYDLDFPRRLKSLAIPEVLVYNLRCQALPYRWRVAISTPAFWACLDLVASLYKNGMIEMAVEWLLLGFMLWLFAGPMVLSWFVFLCRRLSTKKRLDLLQTLAVIFGVMPLVVVLAGFFVYLQVTMADPLLRAGLFAIAVFCFSLASWCLQSSARSFHSKVKPHPET